MAVEIAILAFCKNEHKKHERLMIDNMTAVSYLQNMGGIKSPECNKLSRNIWKWAEVRKMWLSAAHIPDTENCTANTDSREFNDDSEWMVSDFVFKIITDLFGTSEIDLFATRLNHKLPIYVSWNPDPYSVSINAFSVSWSQSYMYCFPPFSVIWKVQKKDQRQYSRSYSNNTTLANSELVSSCTSDVHCTAPSVWQPTSAAARNNQETSSFSQNGAAGSSCIR